MATAPVPMFAPDGTVRDIPADQVSAATSGGLEFAHSMLAPDGTTRYIPHSQLGPALRGGLLPIGAAPKAPQVDMQPYGGSVTQALDAAGARFADVGEQGLKNLNTPVWAPGKFDNLPGPVDSIKALNPLNNPSGRQDMPGRVGETIANTALLAPLLRGIRPMLNQMPAPAPEPTAAENFSAKIETAPQAATVPEAAALRNPMALAGAEKIFRAAAPVGSDPMFRSNLYTATGDLAEIGRTIDLAEAKGGTIRPDMRVRATVAGINDHLRQMYETERAPQIARNADAQVVNKFGADAQGGLDYLTKSAGTAADRALAEKATSNPALPLSDVDALARVVNRELAPLRGATPQELALSGNSAKLSSLQALDRELSQSIGQELQNRGEPGLSAYERRYATLSQVRDQLQSRMNMAELQRHTPVISAINMLRKPSIAGASQAATANITLGSELQTGLKMLAKSGISANRPSGNGAPPIKGLLRPGATELPAYGEPRGPQSTPQSASATTRAQRLGLLLPERTAIDLPAGMEPWRTNNAPQSSLPYRPSLQQPPAFVKPGQIKPAAPEPTLLPDGELWQLLIGNR